MKKLASRLGVGSIRCAFRGRLIPVMPSARASSLVYFPGYMLNQFSLPLLMLQLGIGFISGSTHARVAFRHCGTSKNTCKSRSRRMLLRHAFPRYNPGRKRHKRWATVTHRPGLTVEDCRTASPPSSRQAPPWVAVAPGRPFRRLRTREVPANLFAEITTRDGDPRSDLGITHRPDPELIQMTASNRLPQAPRPAGSLRQGGSRSLL